MFDFYEKRRLRAILFSPITAGVLFVITLLLFVSAHGRYVAERETRERRIESAEELEALRERAAVLESKVERMESERGIEEEIRTQFDVAREGEKVVVVLDERNENTGTSEPKIYPLPPEPTLLDWFKFW